MNAYHELDTNSLSKLTELYGVIIRDGVLKGVQEENNLKVSVYIIMRSVYLERSSVD